MSLFTSRTAFDTQKGPRRIVHYPKSVPLNQVATEDVGVDDSDESDNDEASSEVESQQALDLSSLREFRRNLEKREVEITIPSHLHLKLTKNVVDAHTASTTRVAMQQLRKGDARQMESVRALTRWCNTEARALGKYKHLWNTLQRSLQVDKTLRSKCKSLQKLKARIEVQNRQTQKCQDEEILLWKKKIAKLKAKIKCQAEKKKLEGIEQAKLQEKDVKNLVAEMVNHLAEIIEQTKPNVPDLKDSHRAEDVKPIKQIENNRVAKRKSQLGKKHRRENLKQGPTKAEIPKNEDAAQLLQEQQKRDERRQNAQRRRREKLITTMRETHEQRMAELQKKIRKLQFEHQQTQNKIDEGGDKYDCVSAKGVELLARIEKMQSATRDMNVLTQQSRSDRIRREKLQFGLVVSNIMKTEFEECVLKAEGLVATFRDDSDRLDVISSCTSCGYPLREPKFDFVSREVRCSHCDQRLKQPNPNSSAALPVLDSFLSRCSVFRVQVHRLSRLGATLFTIINSKRKIEV